MDDGLKNTELRSRETQEIMNNKPPFIVRWGMTMLLLVMVGFIVALMVTKKPEELYFLIQSMLHI